MKKFILFTLVFLLTACSNSLSVRTLDIPSPDQELHQSEAGLSLSISKDIYTDPTPVFDAELKNESGKDFGYGAYYRMEMLEEDGWHIMTHSDAVFLENPDFKNFGLILKSGAVTQQTFSVDMLGVKLIRGQYRLVKTFLAPAEPFYEVTLAVPFTVE
ncbi:immunoglobulin-like domain-containing protein [Sporosarcina sp. P33]|uniref:immunoglobulin-like domain-containing protein n=1 Tax=Sporosarcina sp. P33 TaxID=1930764 RepID=UPI0009BF88B6|nr:immunoglobulin-like domain-containing protein [Sporosarcina sp. P33]ARD48671.1 hypothetical protein SporoP33_10855 [Sporosarcina sp. P33]